MRLMRKRRLYYLSLVFILIYILSLINTPSYYVSAANASDWIFEGPNNTYFKILDVNNDYVVLWGEHNKSTSKYKYNTDGFFITKEKYTTSGAFPTGSNKSKRIYTKIKDDPDGNRIYSTYKMKSSDFIGAVGDLGIKGEDIDSNGRVIVYLQTAFKTLEGENETRRNIIGLQEMIKAPVKYNLGFTSWSQDTIEILPSYYNLPFYLYITYNLKVIPVDKDGNKLSDTPLESKKVIYREDYNFTPESTISYKAKEYKYSGQWKYEYTDRESEDEKKQGLFNKKLELKVPDAELDSTLTINVIYEPTGEEATPTPSPGPGTGTPTPTPKPTPMPEVPPPEIPEPDSAELPFTEVVTTGKIRADVRGSERFVATLGVPTTESLYGEVTAKEYLLGYEFEKKVGMKYYSVPVSKDYILNWETATPIEEGGPQPITETVTITQHVTVPRAYGYWEITNLESYRIDNAVLNNYALPDGSITINPNSTYYSPPPISVTHSSSESYHIIPPEEVSRGITLPSQTLTGGVDKPSIPSEDFTYEGLTRTGKIRVKNDRLIFDGDMVMNNVSIETEGPDPNLDAIPQCETFTHKSALYKPDQIIEAKKKNGTYGSTGTIYYKSIALVNPTKPNKISYSIHGINDVVIHTPVVCKPIVTADNKKYVQLIDPQEDAVQIVLDEDRNLSDFTVQISNTGPHSSKQGYFTRDFSRSLRDPDVSYIAEKEGLLRNELKFPFDVYIDIGKDNDPENDEYIKAGTWITIGRTIPRFYLPMWINEGVYIADFRTVAVNGEPFINKTEEYANTDLHNYVATNTVKFEVSGRMYGLSIYDITDYPIWKESFRVPKSLDLKKNFPTIYQDGTKKSHYNKDYAYTYTVGTNDQYGNDTGRNIKYTFPLVNGSHPFYKNMGILKTGYKIRFSLETTGTMYSDDNYVIMKPSFYFVDKEGKNRKAVDLYYTEEIKGKSKHLVKMGSALDKTNLKETTTGDPYLGIPENELKQTAELRKIRYGNFLTKRTPVFSFTEIRLNALLRTYVNENYKEFVKSLDSFENVLDAGVKESTITETKQRWYGEYYLPNEVHAAPKGFDVMDYADKYGVDYSEDFWLDDGYIIIHMNIYTVGKNGTRRLSYVNASNYDDGYCSMWVMEGPPLTKQSYKGPEFKFFAGDFFIYYINKRMSEDYTGGAIY